MNKILIIEDEPPISNLIRLSLTKNSYACRCAFDGMEAADILENERFDLILLDVMLPKLDGFELMEYIRPLEIPVIFLTAKSSVDDIVRGLRMGAEDYIVKPFEIAELLARVDVVLRRFGKQDCILEFGSVRVDTVSMCVWLDGKAVALTPKEYELLLLFMRNQGRALSRDVIYECVWGGELEFGSRTVDLHVQRLRKKLCWEDKLHAVNKVGYRLGGQE